MTELNSDTKRTILNQLILEQQASQYSLQVQHNAYAPLKSERAQSVLKMVEAQLVEIAQVVANLEQQLAELPPPGAQE